MQMPCGCLFCEFQHLNEDNRHSNTPHPFSENPLFTQKIYAFPLNDVWYVNALLITYHLPASEGLFIFNFRILFGHGSWSLEFNILPKYSMPIRPISVPARPCIKNFLIRPDHTPFRIFNFRSMLSAWYANKFQLLLNSVTSINEVNVLSCAQGVFITFNISGITSRSNDSLELFMKRIK